METIRTPFRAVLVTSCFLAPGAFAADDALAVPHSIAGAFSKGKVSLNVRARYEGVDQTGHEDADANTICTRLGFTTAPVNGFRAVIEAENITALDGDRYSQAGLNPDGAGRAVVADPEGTEIDQVFLAYSQGKSTFAAGRQRLVLDNARFVGDVGWRQKPR